MTKISLRFKKWKVSSDEKYQNYKISEAQFSQQKMAWTPTSFQRQTLSRNVLVKFRQGIYLNHMKLSNQMDPLNEGPHVCFLSEEVILAAISPSFIIMPVLDEGEE